MSSAHSEKLSKQTKGNSCVDQGPHGTNAITCTQSPARLGTEKTLISCHIATGLTASSQKVSQLLVLITIQFVVFVSVNFVE